MLIFKIISHFPHKPSGKVNTKICKSVLQTLVVFIISEMHTTTKIWTFKLGSNQPFNN